MQKTDDRSQKNNTRELRGRRLALGLGMLGGVQRPDARGRGVEKFAILLQRAMKRRNNRERETIVLDNQRFDGALMGGAGLKGERKFHTMAGSIGKRAFKFGGERGRHLRSSISRCLLHGGGKRGGKSGILKSTFEWKLGGQGGRSSGRILHIDPSKDAIEQKNQREGGV